MQRREFLAGSAATALAMAGKAATGQARDAQRSIPLLTESQPENAAKMIPNCCSGALCHLNPAGRRNKYRNIDPGRISP